MTIDQLKTSFNFLKNCGNFFFKIKNAQENNLKEEKEQKKSKKMEENKKK